MNNKKLIIADIALVAVIAILAGVFVLTREKPQEGSKTITVTVVHQDKTEKTFTYHTDEAYLDKVLIAEKLIEGYEDQYGFVVEKVEGEEANWENGVFWALYIGQEQATTGISQVVVTDGGSYKLVYEAFA